MLSCVHYCDVIIYVMFEGGGIIFYERLAVVSSRSVSHTHTNFIQSVYMGWFLAAFRQC